MTAQIQRAKVIDLHVEQQFLLADRRHIFLQNLITEDSSNNLYRLLLYMTEKSKQPITLHMSTPGGSIYAGLAMYDMIQQTTKAVPVNILVNGSCMSMGVPILQAGTNRVATPNSTFLLHELSGGFIGTLGQIEDTRKEVLRLQKLLTEIVSKRSGVPEKKLRKLFERKDLFIDAPTALKYNLIDKIL